jgi:polysaccharide export outer membrane protein
MKIKVGIIYSLFFLLLIFGSSCASRKVTYFQTKEKRKGEVVDLPSYRLDNTIRFQPDDILGITVNVPGEPTVAADYNLPLVPAATTENSSEDNVSQGMGRQAFLINKDGTIDFPVLGLIKVAGYTQGELEKRLKELLSEKLIAPPVVTVRLLNFTITLEGEVGSPGIKTVDKDHINLLEALALGNDMSITGKRDDVQIYRQNPDGSYKRISVDMSKEDIISSPYYFLHQNDVVYVPPTRAKSQSADISPRYGFILGIASLALSLYVFAVSIK